ncbi:glycosyl transferase family 2 [Motilibacter peucedani]|uniref:Glycosyl transferase family 2 n=1 Tax=Motilibacter peucedani TaxID=598650 RepID=A0A420XTH2_9ACTN|nr:glycosyltransferase family 2 protein [Motilibacter peucedani]RKS80162.1 glycosyl transferase family 2 [Motilibacter peucedani]
MKRSPASVVVVAQHGPEGRARADFLARALRPSLGVRDELVVVADGEPGMSEIAAARLDDAQDLAARRLSGARRAKHAVTVLVCADCLPPSHAIDPLVVAVAAGSVAAGPLHDLGVGRQCVTAPVKALASPQALRDWARVWRDEHRGETRTVPALGEGVIAVRTDALLADGGLPGLGERLGAVGTLTVVADSVWHHRGTRGCGLAPRRAPLLSAVYIVKDEEELLPSSLAALEGVADEVVVYDTGSTDRTVEIARAAGARVVLGYWDEHFGDARNRALSHAFGDWHLQVDADEVLEVGDVALFRRALQEATTEALAIDVENITGNGMGTPQTGLVRRLARRDEGWFAGRLHEEVLHREGRGPVQGALRGVTLVHSGYLAARTEERDKAGRNLRLASLGLADAVPEGLTKGTALANLARSQRFAGDNEGVLRTAALAEGESFPPINWRELCHAAAVAAASLGRFDVAHEWLDKLTASMTDPVGSYEIAAEVLLAEGRYEDVLDVVSRMPVEGKDENNRVVRRDGALTFEIAALSRLGRAPEAAWRVVEVVRTGSMNISLERVLALFEAEPAALDAYVAALHDSMVMLTLAESRWVRPERADALLEAMWRAGRARSAVLAAATVVAPRLTVLRALEWAARLRGAGVSDCALVALARDTGRSPRDRVLAAALVIEAFGDDRTMPDLVAAAELIPDAEADAVGAELRTVAPRVAAQLLAA